MARRKRFFNYKNVFSKNDANTEILVKRILVVSAADKLANRFFLNKKFLTNKNITKKEDIVMISLKNSKTKKAKGILDTKEKVEKMHKNLENATDDTKKGGKQDER